MIDPFKGVNFQGNNCIEVFGFSCEDNNISTCKENEPFEKCCRTDEQYHKSIALKKIYQPSTETQKNPFFAVHQCYEDKGTTIIASAYKLEKQPNPLEASSILSSEQFTVFGSPASKHLVRSIGKKALALLSYESQGCEKSLNNEGKYVYTCVLGGLENPIINPNSPSFEVLELPKSQPTPSTQSTTSTQNESVSLDDSIDYVSILKTGGIVLGLVAVAAAAAYVVDKVFQKKEETIS